MKHSAWQAGRIFLPEEKWVSFIPEFTQHRLLFYDICLAVKFTQKRFKRNGIEVVIIQRRNQ